jgi:hypothetical protein
MEKLYIIKEENPENPENNPENPENNPENKKNPKNHANK